jgi:hypothetical protein
MKKRVIVRKASVERPGDVGMDLPPGATAKELSPTDYHPVDMEAPEKAPQRRVGSAVRRGTARGRR